MRFSFLPLALSTLMLPAAAHAANFTFSSVGSGGGFSGSGTLTTTANANGSYTITGITGTGVIGLISTNPGFFGNDNLLFPTASRLVNVNGFAFTEAAPGLTISVNIFSTVSGYEAITLDSDGDFNDTPVTFTLAPTAAPTPEPSSLLLLGSGVLATVATRIRRRLSA